MAKEKIQSVEPDIADLANGWMKSYGLDYKLEQASLNTEIDKALDEYYSKSGGSGGNRPDVKLLLQDKNMNYYPVLIEYKGYKDKLVKLDDNGQVENRNTKNEPIYKNINSYAVNGAVHYANALLHYTSYTDIIAIGITGYKDENGKLLYSMGVYYVSRSNYGVGQKIDDYTDLSFLKTENFDSFIEKIRNLQLSPKELGKLREKREKEIDASLVKLNNDIYQNEKGLGENDRVYLVAASIISTLGIPGKVAPLEKSDLKSSSEAENKDGDIMVRKITAFLNEKNLPKEKSELIIRTLQNTLTTDNINKVENGESQLKRVFTKIVDDLGIYYKIGLTTDFTGKLFNEMYSWLGFTQDKLNDVGKCIPENKLQKMYEYGGVMYLRSPKIEGEKFYKAIIKAYYSGEPKRNMIFPKYYDEMLNDEDLWLVDSLSGTWFEIVEIKEISKTQAERLKLVSNGKRAVDVLSCTRSSMLYVNE